jgi:predicted ArsR family transcriptional regulator
MAAYEIEAKGPGRRPATLAEARALAHPLRLRILRLCLDEQLTNKQLADRLGATPGTVIHHVRTLVATGFLAPVEVRYGETGALEKPYRSTGKSWTLSVQETGREMDVNLASIDAFRSELLEAGDASVETFARLALTLGDAEREQLVRRIEDIVREYAGLPSDPDGKPYALLVAVHRRAWPARQ